MSTPPVDATGFPKRIGRYELLEKIASGGMATVYLGRALGARGFERVVAVKKLHPVLEANPETVASFFEEARVAARIRHPNVVPTLDVDDGDGHCLVMEYVEGDQLSGLLRAAASSGTRIPPEIAVRIAIDVLSGLHAAHELTDDDGRPLRVVHRDVSPQNVLVGVDGVAKLTDFGIAKIGDTVTDAQAEELKGKLAYMAPEQALGERVDRRADVFSAGIVIWELFAARRLFTGDSSAGTLSAVLASPIPRLDKAAALPEALASVVAKALERDLDDRWQTAAEFSEALEQAAHAGSGIAPAKRVAEHVLAVSGEKIARERERLRRAVTARPSTTPSPLDAGTASPLDAGTASPLDAGTASPLDAGTASPAQSPAQAPAQTAPRRGTRGLAMIGVALALFAVVAALAAFRGRARDAAGVSASASPPALVAPSPSVTTEASAAPSNATGASGASSVTTAASTLSSRSSSPGGAHGTRRPPVHAAPSSESLPRNPYRRAP